MFYFAGHVIADSLQVTVRIMMYQPSNFDSSEPRIRQNHSVHSTVNARASVISSILTLCVVVSGYGILWGRGLKATVPESCALSQKATISCHTSDGIPTTGCMYHCPLTLACNSNDLGLLSCIPARNFFVLIFHLLIPQRRKVIQQQFHLIIAQFRALGSGVAAV